MQDKNALLIGCGSKWGAEFSKVVADSGYSVDLVTSNSLTYTNVNEIKVNWYNFNRSSIVDNIKLKNYDIIFFNQNSGGSVNEFYLKEGNIISEEQWNINFWIDCQLPYYIIKHLGPVITTSTKIGWMITGLISGRDENLFQYAGYACAKSSNLHIMRGFSQFSKGTYFAINPWWFPLEKYKEDAEQILKVIESLTNKDSGKTFNKNGEEWI